jgi:hypothetical protein
LSKDPSSSPSQRLKSSLKKATYHLTKKRNPFQHE